MMELYLDQKTAHGQSYSGSAERCVFKFQTGPEQLGYLDDWMRQNYVNEVTNEVESKGGKILQLRLWRDKSPTWTTDYIGEIIADVSGEFNLQSPFPWTIVVTASLLGIVSYFLIRPTVESVTDLVWGSGSGEFPWMLLIIGGVAAIALLRS